MATIITIYKHTEESHARALTERFDSDKEARDSFNSAVRYYVTCSKGYTLVHVDLILSDGRKFNFDFSMGQ